MNFFTNIEQTQILRSAQPFHAFVPLHRRLFAIAQPLPRRRRRRKARPAAA